MLNKLVKLLIILGVIGIIGSIGFVVFVNPSGFTDKEDLIESYFNSIESATTCTKHFNSETEDFCSNFQDLIGTKTVEITDLSKNGDDYLMTILIDDVEMNFRITFIEIDVSGVKSFLNKTYYKIDFIQ